jgi:hypothetical protein
MTARAYAALALCLVGAHDALAEPYLAVETGLACGQCHANPTGGGLRTPFGLAWAANQMSASQPGDPAAGAWTGQLGERVSLGGNLRADASGTWIPDAEDASEFEVSEARLYLQLALLPDRLAVYVDERLAPGGATNLESNLRLSFAGGEAWLKAGRMYLPFGWRLEDDNAFVRQLSGINMQTPDEGVELGLARGAWNLQLALANGSGGGPETDQGKQVVARAEFIQPRWRAGASALFNDADAGERLAAALFAGLRVGPTQWLAEVDVVDDEGLGAEGRVLIAALLEMDWRVRKGHNLKLVHEWLDPDDDVDEDEQTRSSALYEWSAVPFLQLRGGVRWYDGPSQIEFQNRTEAFLQLHGYF